MNKRLIAALCVVCSVALAVGGCASKENPNVIVSVDTLTAVPVPSNGTVSPYIAETLGPDSSLPPFDISPSPFATPTPLPTPRQSGTPGNPTQTPGSAPNVTPSPGNHTFVPGQSADQAVFDNCAFVGNSIFEGLHLYGVITHGKFFTKVGLNLSTVYTATTTNGNKPVIDELNTGAYSGVILMFGQNELGWPNQNAFIQRYEKLVKEIKARQSGAQIFLTGKTKYVSGQGSFSRVKCHHSESSGRNPCFTIRRCRSIRFSCCAPLTPG